MIANPMRGEADLGEHKLVVDFNSICALESAMGMKAPELLYMIKSGIGFGFTELRKFIQVFIDKDMSLDDVGSLIGSLGMIDVPVPAELRKKGDPETQQVWTAADALGRAMDGFFLPKEPSARPLKAA